MAIVAVIAVEHQQSISSGSVDDYADVNFNHYDIDNNNNNNDDDVDDQLIKRKLMIEFVVTFHSQSP